MTVEILSSVVGESQISLIECWRHILASILLTVDCGWLYLTCCCALKRTGTFASESKVMYFILLILKSDVLMFIPDINQRVNSCFDTEKH